MGKDDLCSTGAAGIDYMRILIAAPAPREREGGVANVVYNISEGLQVRGHVVTCLFAEDVLPRPVAVPRFQNFYFAWRLAALVSKRRRDFDVVNIHAPAGFLYGIKRRLSAGKSLPPYVMFLHGIEERRNHAMSREAKKGRAMFFRPKNRIWQRLYHMPQYRWSISTADQAVVINRETSILLQLKYNCDAERVWYVPNAVEPRFFCDGEYREGRALRLLFVGTWLDHKGIYYLRDSFEILAKRVPGLRLTVAGCRAEVDMVKMFFAPGTRDSVDVIPFVSRLQMPELYLEHDIFVMPSLMEGLPIVLLEAMATGRPIVATETCGLMDLIEDDYNGLLVKPADADGLVESILRMIDSRELRVRLGQAAQHTAKRHSWQRVAADLEKVFERAVANEKGLTK